MHARLTGRLAVAALVLLVTPLSAPAQSQADAYYEFLLGHRLDGEGDDKGALAAFERAAAAAPASAHVRAEIAALHLRQNQVAAAEKAARAALALDPDSTEAHRVLGLALSGQPDTMKEAVTHLEKVMATPTGATDVSLQFTLGRLYLITGAAAKAVDVLTRIVEEQPFLMQARLTLVQALTSLGRVAEAIDLLAPVAGTDPRLNTTLAQLLTRAGRVRETADALGRSAAANPGNREAQMQYAAALLATGSKDDARKALGAVGPLVERNGRDTGALYLQAQALRRVGDVFAAERAARAMLAVDAKSVAGMSALAQALGQSRRYKDVIDTVQGFLAGPGQGLEVASLLSYLSTAYQSLGQHDKAIDALKRAKTADPEDGTLDLYLVQAYLTARRYADAAALAETAQRAEPDDLRYTMLQARARFLAGDRPAALTLLERAVDTTPGSLELQLSLAGLYGQAGRVDDGLAVLAKAEARFPGAGAIAFRRGAVLGEARRHADAERVFRGILAQEPRNADALNYLGYMLADQGRNLDEAVELVTRALAEDEDNPSFLDSLGWAYFKKGDYTQADKFLARASDALPTNSVVQDHYGDVLARLGRQKEALLAWEKALAGDGEEIDRAAVERKLRGTPRTRK
jgi:tetratricopeptide (TPR) repeat protein